jgi:cellulose synthase/poly-beta-1,6-N-acetylglucosamine synthase-like glycosyltransferase
VSLLLDALGWLVVFASAVAALAFVLETSAGLLPAKPKPGRGAAYGSAVILIPAHDEALGIAQMLAALRQQLPENARILVVADNCTDATAQIARYAGAEVAERHDPARRGKGYALEFGRSRLQASAPDVVIVLDADCTIDRASIERLAGEAVRRQSPVQATYLLKASLSAPPMVQISNFAFMVKNDIRQRGGARLGAPAMLTGTGMAFPWAVFNGMSLSGGSVEDLDLTVELVRRGIQPVFVPDATVLSEPAGLAASVMQRDRWERGFVSAARRASLPLFGLFARTGRVPPLWLALHLLTPPLALLVLLASLAAVLLGALHILAGMSAGPLAVQLGLLFLIAALVGAAWATKGRPYVSLATVLKIPLYVLWKLPIYARMLLGAEQKWNRTDRSGH